MKVGKWRRERLGEGAGGARWWIAFMILVLFLFGLSRFYLVWDVESMFAEDADKSDDGNVVLPAANETALNLTST